MRAVLKASPLLLLCGLWRDVGASQGQNFWPFYCFDLTLSGRVCTLSCFLEHSFMVKSYRVGDDFIASSSSNWTSRRLGLGLDNCIFSKFPLVLISNSIFFHKYDYNGGQNHENLIWELFFSVGCSSGYLFWRIKKATYQISFNFIYKYLAWAASDNLMCLLDLVGLRGICLDRGLDWT